MDFKQKTFRKCGSHYSDLGALDGVEVKVGQSFQPPRKVALPVGFHQNDPTEVLSLSYDFSLENEVIARTEELKAKQQQQEEEEDLKKAEEPATDKDLTTTPSISTGQAIFSSVGTDILQPTTCITIGHKRNDSLGKNAFDLSDFEAQDTNPFELVELQTINDLDELKSVLQPSTQPMPPQVTHSVAVAVATKVIDSGLGELKQPTQPLNYAASQSPEVSNNQPVKTNINSKLSKSVPDLSSNQLVDISSDESMSGETQNITNSNSVSLPSAMTGPSQPNTIPSMGYGMPSQPFSYLHGLQTNPFSGAPVPQSNPVLVDVSGSGPVVPPTPLVHSLPPLSSTPTPLVCSGQTTHPMAGAGLQLPSNVKLPPLRKPPPIPPRPTSHKKDNSSDNLSSSSSNSGSSNVVNALSHPEKTGKGTPITATSNQDTSRSGNPKNQSDGELNSSLNQSLIKRKPAQRRNKSNMDKSRHHSTPLPHIPHSSGPEPPPSLQSNLPDPTPVLTDSEKRFVEYIRILGFPVPRIARAVQRLGEKEKEVIDFLVAVEQLSQGGFEEDDVEIALSLNDDDDKKALEFLQLSRSFKQLGFEESYIQEALRAADNDRDKALDFLTSITAS